NTYSLLLATRKFFGESVGLVLEIDDIEGARNALFHIALVYAQSPENVGDVIVGSLTRKQSVILENDSQSATKQRNLPRREAIQIDSSDKHASGSWNVFPVQEPHQSR